MNCPVCKEVELRISERQNVEIDHCPQCRGVWLDRGELDKLIERSMQQESPRREMPLGDAPREYSAPAPQAPPNYPQQPPQQPRYEEPRYEKRRDRDDDDDDDYYRRHGKKRKKGGWLGEILDFD